MEASCVFEQPSLVANHLCLSPTLILRVGSQTDFFGIVNGKGHSTNDVQTSFNVDVLFEFLLQNFSPLR